jgi:16S rRNA (guanine527-N7)-methyltransferase
VRRFDQKSWDVFCERLCDFAGKTIEFDDGFRLHLEMFLSLLLDQNRIVNLTAIDGWDEGIWKHLLDSLGLVHFNNLGSVVDLGTGGGLPGVPLLLYRHFVLKSSDKVVFVDSVGKKIASVRYFLDKLGFDGVRLAHIVRGETYIVSNPVDSVVMRAVAPPDRAVEWMNSRVKNWLIFCGPNNLDAWLSSSSLISRKGFELTEKYDFSLPFSLGERSILKFSLKK